VRHDAENQHASFWRIRRQLLQRVPDLSAYATKMRVPLLRADLLLQHPNIRTRTSDPAIRRMTTTPYPYLVFFEAADTEIIIHAVRHAARDPSGMPGSA
jgi:hypothetical protein